MYANVHTHAVIHMHMHTRTHFVAKFLSKQDHPALMVIRMSHGIITGDTVPYSAEWWLAFKNLEGHEVVIKKKYGMCIHVIIYLCSPFIYPLKYSLFFSSPSTTV